MFGVPWISPDTCKGGCLSMKRRALRKQNVIKYVERACFFLIQYIFVLSSFFLKWIEQAVGWDHCKKMKPLLMDLIYLNFINFNLSINFRQFIAVPFFIALLSITKSGIRTKASEKIRLTALLRRISHNLTCLFDQWFEHVKVNQNR